MTNQREAHEAQHETAPCTPDCPVARTAAIIEGKWTTLIVRELLPGTKRFGEVQKALPGISPKVLTERLRMLEDQSLVARTVHPCVPPKTEYTLTPLGLELRGVIQAMADYGMRLGNRRAAPNLTSSARHPEA